MENFFYKSTENLPFEMILFQTFLRNRTVNLVMNMVGWQKGMVRKDEDSESGDTVQSVG